jgi:hypothetical protein
MQTSKACVLILMLMLGACTQQARLETPPAQSAFDWSADIDTAALREQIGWSDEYDERCLTERPLENMVNAMNAGEWGKASDIGETWLQQCPIDIRIHFYSGISLSRQAKGAQAEQHFRWADSLMDAVAASGDGRSCATAYVTVSMSEEYDAMELFGLINDNPAPIDDGSACDMFSVRDRDGIESTIYFHASAQIARYASYCQNKSQQISFAGNCL